MYWLRWIGLLLILLHAVAFIMVGRFWTVLHLAHVSTITVDPYGPQLPANPMSGVWLGVAVSLAAVVLLAPALYLLGRTFPRAAPYLLLLVIAASVGLPVFDTLMTPPSVAQRAEQLKYLNAFRANCFICVMGVLFGTALVALADGVSSRPEPVAVPKKPEKRRRKPVRLEPLD